jgi:hypothetical protein
MRQPGRSRCPGKEKPGLIDADDNRSNVLGYYANSLSGEWWAPEHPAFRPYVRGLMTCEHTPDAIRSDRALLREFPPRPLEGLNDEYLAWQSPDARADARMRAMCAAADAGSAGGL